MNQFAALLGRRRTDVINNNQPTRQPRRLAAEFLGTALLLTTIVGSGMMADTLSGGNDALALLGNAIATGAMLFVLITVLAPVSGAHFNPAVTLVFRLRGELSTKLSVAYCSMQLLGAVVGVLLAHAMFEAPLLDVAQTARFGTGASLSEAIATFGLLMTILGTIRYGSVIVAAGVGLYISAGYWFTASTSFANPAVTIARSLTDTFTGIRPNDVPLFIVAQLVGAAVALGVFAWLLEVPATDESPTKD